MYSYDHWQYQEEPEPSVYRGLRGSESLKRMCRKGLPLIEDTEGSFRRPYGLLAARTTPNEVHGIT